MALEIIKRKTSANRFMIVTPKTLIKSAWLDDQRCFYPSLKLLPLSRNMSKHDYADISARWGVSGGVDDLCDWADAYVINPESFKRDVSNLPTVQGLILDESTLVRNKSDTTTEITKYADKLAYRYIMTGKPNVNGLMNYFGQMRVVDAAVLGRSFFAFRAKYFETHDRFGYVWTPKIGAPEEIAKRVATLSIDVRKEECLDLPERTFSIRHVELPPKVMTQYKQLEREAVLALGDTMLTAPMQLTLMGKLRQFTGGHVITDDGPVPVHTAKMAVLQEVLDEIGDRQVLIWAQYKHEIAAIAEHLRGNGATVVTANSETRDIDADIAAFKSGEAQYMVAHPASIKFGVTFIKCTDAVYYSKSFDMEEWYQSCDRIYRKGQELPCTYVSLVVPGTIDEDIEHAVGRKGTAAAAMESLIGRATGR